MTSVLIKEGNLETDVNTRRTPWEDEGRDQDAFINQETLKIASRTPETKKESRNRFFHPALEETNPANITH